MLVLFDLDDTLLDHEGADRKAAACLYETIGSGRPLPAFFESWRAAQERHYARYNAGEISFQQQRRERLREVIDTNLDEKTADEIFAHYLMAYENNWSLFDDVTPCLEGLSAHRLGLITNGDGALQRRKLKATGLLDRLDYIIISGEYGLSKPDARIFLHACDLANEVPSNVLYVGDHYDLDAEGARNAGLQGVWINRKDTATPRHAPPIITSLDGLRPLLSRY